MSSNSLLLDTFVWSACLFGVSFGATSYTYCDNDYNSSACVNTTLDDGDIYKCRGFLSCKGSTVSTSYDLFCQGDRSCKDVVYDNNDDDELWALGYRSADSLTMADEANDAYCYGYQSCLDIVFDQDDTGNDAVAHGYQSMYNAYIDYSNAVDVNGYQGLYRATINTTSVYGDEIDITVNGYYGSYETDILCQDGMTCNFYAYGWYATEETYLYCLNGATCNVYCGETNGCQGMNIYCYSTATCYFDCDDASACPNEEDASAMAKLTGYETSSEEMNAKFDEKLKERMAFKREKQLVFKQERFEEERVALSKIDAAERKAKTLATMQHMKGLIVEFIVILTIGIVIGVIGTQWYNSCKNNKDYAYQSIN